MTKIKSMITAQRVMNILVTVGVIGALALGATGVITLAEAGEIIEQLEANEATARGTSNFDALEVDSITVGTSSLYPLLVDDSSEAIYVATGSITTTAVEAATHGLSAISGALCTLGESPGTGAGDGALCFAVVAGTTVTLTVNQDDWTTAATNATAVHYIILGTP